MSDRPETQEIERWHRWMAIELFNRTWEVLESDRGPEEDRELLATALASWLHWRRVGEPRNFAVSDWQVSRVYAVLGDAGRSEEYGRASLRLAEENELGPFHVGYGCEALARAAAVAGDEEQRRSWLERARREAAGVADEEERALLLSDLETV